MKIQQRLIAIFNILLGNKKYTRLELIRVIANQFQSYSQATLTRDLDKLKGLGLSINYKDHNYEIDLNESNEGISFFKTLEFLYFNKSLSSEGKKDRNLMIFDYGNRDLNSGTELMSIILKAIRNNKEVIIDYLNFDQIGEKDWAIQPLFFREYDSRWYLIVENKTQRGHSIALDRIRDIKTSTKSFIPSGKITPNLFTNCIGCNLNSKIEKVVLAVQDYQMFYFKTKPIHASQKIINNQPGKYKISIEVRTNFELIQTLLKYGTQIKIISPKSLEEKMKLEYKKAYEMYL